MSSVFVAQAGSEDDFRGITKCRQSEGWHVYAAGPCFESMEEAVEYRNRLDFAGVAYWPLLAPPPPRPPVGWVNPRAPQRWVSRVTEANALTVSGTIGLVPSLGEPAGGSYTPITSEVRIKYKLASGVGDAANDEFDRWLNTTFVAPAARAAEQLQEALAARDRVFAAARAEINNLANARGHVPVYVYWGIHERLRSALSPQPETTTTESALAEGGDAVHWIERRN